MVSCALVPESSRARTLRKAMQYARSSKRTSPSHRIGSAAYGTARTFAQQLGFSDIATTLQQTLDEEGDTDKKLTKLAKSAINLDAIYVPRTGKKKNDDTSLTQRAKQLMTKLAG